MLRHFFTFFTLVLSLTAICQETKLVTKKFNDSKQISECYSVLKSDGKTKHGEYISYFKAEGNVNKQIRKGTFKSENYIKQKCTYKYGKKDGEWIKYSQRFQLEVKGNYKEDKKVGIWLTSMERGQVIERFDFDTKKKLSPTITINAHYPESAVSAKLQGTVIVSFQTHQDCTISNISITKSLSADCDKAAIEAIKRFGEFYKRYGIDCQEKTETQTYNFTFN
jgi:TonB family protein